MTKRNTASAPAIDRPWWTKLGPGLITGAADDDPSGIATYSQGGAQFGFNVAWTVLFTYPLMVAIQLASARIGRVTGRGLTKTLQGSVRAGSSMAWWRSSCSPTRSTSAPI